MFDFSRRILVFFVYFLTIFRERARQIWLVYSVIRFQLTESVIRLRNQLNWELLSAGPHPIHNVVNFFLKNYSYFYTKVKFINYPLLHACVFIRYFKKRSWNKLKHKNLWKCRSRKAAEKLECFLTKNFNPLHCCEMHRLLSNQNKQPVTSSQKWRETWKAQSRCPWKFLSFGKTRIAVNLHFIEDFYRICIVEWI